MNESLLVIVLLVLILVEQSRLRRQARDTLLGRTNIAGEHTPVTVIVQGPEGAIHGLSADESAAALQVAPVFRLTVNQSYKLRFVPINGGQLNNAAPMETAVYRLGVNAQVATGQKTVTFAPQPIASPTLIVVMNETAAQLTLRVNNVPAGVYLLLRRLNGTSSTGAPTVFTAHFLFTV